MAVGASSFDSPLGGGCIVSDMTIGELARCCGLAVRTLRFYADAGVLPETSRSESGYRLFGPVLGATLFERGIGVRRR